MYKSKLKMCRALWNQYKDVCIQLVMAYTMFAYLHDIKMLKSNLSIFVVNVVCTLTSLNMKKLNWKSSAYVIK